MCIRDRLTTAPESWRVGAEAVTYDWFDSVGADPLDLTDAEEAEPGI